jgi:hypothetical protein
MSDAVTDARIDAMHDLASELINLPGRPIAEDIARELLFAGADLKQCVLGTFGDDKLHLFRYGQGTLGLRISRGDDGYDIETSEYDLKAWRTDCRRLHRVASGLAASAVADVVNTHFAA